MVNSASQSSATNNTPEINIRKSDHLQLAIQSQTSVKELDHRFYYEPMLSGFPKGDGMEVPFAGKTMKVPLWVSSMTGGHALSGAINRNLAEACKEFGLGMGLGSCRVLLENEELFDDFNLRPILGEDAPFFANLGIAQVEELLETHQIDKISRMVDRLKADGLIVHVNPLQEWIQPEGNFIHHPPIQTITRLLELSDLKIIVKEVGQGFGPQSIRSLLQLPLAAIEFGAFGGTNFAKIENSRIAGTEHSHHFPFVKVGVTAIEMVEIINGMVIRGDHLVCNQLIISGGIRDYLDGYYLIKKSMVPAIYAQASGFLRKSQEGYATLRKYIMEQIDGFQMAQNYLTIK